MTADTTVVVGQFVEKLLPLEVAPSILKALYHLRRITVYKLLSIDPVNLHENLPDVVQTTSESQVKDSEGSANTYCK